MKVLYDHQIFTVQNFGGISRYFSELLKCQGAAAELAMVYSDNEYLTPELTARSQIRPKKNVKRPPPWVRLFNRRATRRHFLIEQANRDRSMVSLRAGKWDVFHPTYYDPYFLEYIGDKPFVVTVYDMIHELFPEYFQLADPASARKKILVEKATHVIAISESTKLDLMSIYGVPSSKVSVVHLGGSLAAEGVDDRLVLPQRYLLFVGTRGGYKNCYFAIRSLSGLLAEQSDLTLVCAGGGAFGDAEQQFFDELGLSERVRYYPAANAQLAALYRGAEAFVFPSLYEGFGIPTIEAFSCECPVIAAKTPALLEIAGDAAEYFDPKSPQALDQAVRNVLLDTERRNELKRSSKVRLELFTWDRCVAQTAAVYESVLNGQC